MTTNRLSLAQPAVRTGQKARVALIGPSGAGKTWTALTVATELAQGGKVLLIDTEEGSGALYADKFKYDHLRWNPPYDPRELTSTLEQAKDYAVVIVDSLSHFWDDEGGLLDIVDSVAARSSSKNSFAAWKEGTPIQKDMVRAFLRIDAHAIVTMRAKTEYVLEQDERTGRTAPKRIGLAPVQRAGMEYEFTVIGLLELNHQLVIDKSRCDQVADKRYLAGKAAQFGKTLAEWLAGAAPEVHQTKEAGTAPTTPTAPASNSVAPSLALDLGETDLEPLYELAGNLPRTPKTRPQLDGMLAEHGYEKTLKNVLNQHKMQCGTGCLHVAVA